MAATAIGVGGMMGAGLYTLVGLAATTAGVWVPLCFAIAAFVATFSVYSYAKLGARYPSSGGAAHFLVASFGDGVISGGLNVFQFFGWIIAMGLYAAGFAGYAADLLPGTSSSVEVKLLAVGLVGAYPGALPYALLQSVVWLLLAAAWVRQLKAASLDRRPNL